MVSSAKSDQWVWVLVQSPEGGEQIVGQLDEASGVSFIPAFLEKEDGLKCYHLISRDTGKKDEFQAILFEELEKNASDNGFMIFIFNGDGDIIEKRAPGGAAS